MNEPSLTKENYRDFILKYLEEKLIGPDLSREDIFEMVNDDPPASRYSTGKLYPKDSTSDEVLSEEDSNSDNAAPSAEDPLSLSFERLPSSIGISICIEKDTELEIICGAGHYVEVDDEEQGKFWQRMSKKETFLINSSFKEKSYRKRHLDKQKIMDSKL